MFDLKNFLIISACVVALMGCEIGNATGYAPTRAEVAEIQVGVDSRETVVEKWGRPTVVGQSENIWYYISAYDVARGPLPERTAERRVLQVTFGSNNRVSRVDELSKENGQNVPLSKSVTPTGGKELKWWQHALDAFGSINPSNFF